MESERKGGGREREKPRNKGRRKDRVIVDFRF